jgi:hypothetical protein
VYLELKYLSCGERYYREWERWRREAEDNGEDTKESEHVCMRKKRDKMLEYENYKDGYGLCRE